MSYQRQFTNRRDGDAAAGPSQDEYWVAARRGSLGRYYDLESAAVWPSDCEESALRDTTSPDSVVDVVRVRIVSRREHRLLMAACMIIGALLGFLFIFLGLVLR